MKTKKTTLLLSAIFVLILGSPSAFAGLFDLFTKNNESDLAKTKYPLVIVGGAIINFEALGPIDYHYNIPQTLEKNGAENVFVTSISGAESNEARGEQLARLVEDILVITDTEKVNLMAISMGGPTSRYVASVYPEMVASVSSTVGGHQGIPLADWIVSGEETMPLINNLLYKIGNFGIGLISWLAGESLPTDTKAMAYSETTKGSQEFNALYPEGAPTSDCGDGPEQASNGVYYYSMAGAKPFTNIFDPTDYILYALHKLFFKKGETSDGVIGSCSSHWGKVIRDDYLMNHMDTANHLFGLTHRRFSPLDLYVQQANRLKNKGL